MKIPIFSRLTIVGLTAAIAFSLIPSSQAKALEKRSFKCEKTTKQDSPKTFTFYKGQKRTVIRWSGPLGEKNPQERCEQATVRIQQAYDNDTIKIITNGIMKKQPVICTADDYGGDCVNLLITLNPQEDSLKVLNQLKEALLGKQKGPVIHTSDTPQIYYEIDLEKAIENAPVEQIPQTVISQASSEGNNTPKYTGIVKQIDDIAEKITVRIDVANGKNGSGVIIGKQGNTYYIATACHVVSLPRSGRKCTTEKLLDTFTLTTPDGEKHTLTSAPNQIIIPNPDFDVAVIKFTSDKTYQVAELGDYQLETTQWLFLSGFPGQDTNKQRSLTAGIFVTKDFGQLVTKDRFSLSNGNGLIYTNLSFGGMSGGAVLDTQGRVVGINTGSEDEVFISSDDVKEISLGYSLGIPMTTFLGLASREKVFAESLRVISTPAKKINDKESALSIAQVTFFKDFKEPPKDSNALEWLKLGNELWRTSFLAYEDAVAAFNQAIQKLEKEGKKETLAKAYYAKGLALLYGSKYQEALEAFTQATVNNSRFYQAWRYQGLMLTYLQQYDQALASYRQAIDHSDKKDFILYGEQGGVLSELTRYQEALDSYNRAIELKPNYFLGYTDRGVLYSDMKKWDLALSDFNQAITLNPKLAQAYVNRGILYKRQEKWELALADYNQAIALDPKFGFAYNNRGNLYADMKKWELALADYNQAIALMSKYLFLNNPGTPLSVYFANVFNNRGTVYEEMKKWELALSDFNQAIILNPKYADAYYNRGILYEELKKWDLALSDYNQAITLNPKFALAYNNRGILYYKQGKWDLAISDYNQAIALNPKFALAYVNRGVVYILAENKQKGIEDLQKAAQLYQEQDDTERYKRVMEVLQQLKN